MKLLVLASDPVDADDVRQALPGDDDVAGAEVLVVAPAVNESPVRFWMSDADAAIARAGETAGGDRRRAAVRGRPGAREDRRGRAATGVAGRVPVTEVTR